MAGVQIDGVNNKIDFDDDADTSISSNTDDTLVFEIAGATDFTMTANTFTAASGSTIASQALTATTLTATGAISLSPLSPKAILQNPSVAVRIDIPAPSPDVPCSITR